MDALSAIQEIVAGVRYLQEVHEIAKKIHVEAADMMGRLLAISPNLESIQGDLQRGRFQDPGQLQALLRLNDTVQTAEQLVSKLSGTKRGGVVAWAKGAWNAKSNMKELQEVATCIDRAVHDLTLCEVRHGFVHQVSRTLEGSGFMGQGQLQTSHTPTTRLRPRSINPFPERRGRGAK